jgi:cbb3-type cytochrome oxidase maturation protein
MESLDILIPIAMIIVVIAITILLWAINNGQFDDLESPSETILFDDTKDKQD